MSILSKITTGRRGRAQKVGIFAPEGFGKSTLASRFPDPLFFDVEKSTDQLDVARLTRDDLPDLASFESALKEVAKTRPCLTLVTDTIDWLEQMVLDAIIAEANNPKIQGIEDFGYGKGYTILKERMTILLSKFDAVIASGINVVLLAHSKVTKFEPPDGAGPYDRYELKLSKQVAPLIKEWADMLIFGNWRTQVREKEKNDPGAQFKGVGGKDRMMYCNRTAAWDAKNRHGMGDVEKWDIAVIEKAFRSVNAPWGETMKPAETEGVKYTSLDRPATEEKTAKPAEKNPLGVVEVSAKPFDKMTRDELVEVKTALLKRIEAGGNDLADIEEAKPQIEVIDALLGKMPSPVTQIRTGGDDQIPGIDNPEPKHEEQPVDAELARICTPHEEVINAYLVGNRKVQMGQSWRHLPADYVTRVKKNPAAFLKAVGIGQGVAA